MREYTELIKFKYNGKNYQMFIDNKGKYFFLEIKNNTYQYVTIEELYELGNLWINIRNVMNIENQNTSKKKLKFIPKVLIGGTATVLTLALLLVIPETVKEINKNIDFGKQTNYVQEYEREEKTEVEKIKEKLSYEGTVENKEFIVDTILENEQIHFIYVYDMDYLNKILDYNSITEQEIHNVIDSNPKISPKYKALFHSYVTDYVKRQPNAETRVLYENLKTIEVVECNERELMLASLSADAAACYIRTENKIYVLDEYEYKKGTWEHQIIYHELSHVARTGFWDTEKDQIRVQCEGLEFYNTTTPEALNSLFAISLFDYEERDIAYQLQSNYYKVMIECMDNYELSDYMNHSLGYFVKKLDETNNQKNYAQYLLALIEAQYNDYHNEKIEVEQKEYYPIYEYISNMYYKKNLNSNMSMDEAEEYYEKLMDEIMFDVPEEYNIDTNYFYDYFINYCNSLGITTQKNKNI